MTAAELMFFLGAPLAHVVAYEDHLKAMRREQAARRLARGSLGRALPRTVTPSPEVDCR